MCLCWVGGAIGELSPVSFMVRREHASLYGNLVEMGHILNARFNLPLRCDTDAEDGIWSLSWE